MSSDQEIQSPMSDCCFGDRSNMKPEEVTFMRRYMNALMKIREHEHVLSELPVDVQKRLQALKKLQTETIALDAKFHSQVYDMERVFQKEHDEVFNRRLAVISGKHEPTDDECYEKLPETPSEVSGEKTLGIPDFWLTVFKYCPKVDMMIGALDEPILKHLADVRVRTRSEPSLSFTLEFHFSPNEFFSNEVLEKEYFLKCSPDPENPFDFDGPEIYKCQGTEIKWKEGKNVLKDESQPGTSSSQSFFAFFSPPEVPEDENDPLFGTVNAILEADFETGHFIKDRIIPRAVLYFLGEAKDLDDSSLADSDVDFIYEPQESTHPNSVQ